MNKKIKIFALTLLAVLAVMGVTKALAEAPSYHITAGSPSVNGYDVTLSGTASANPCAGQVDAQYVSVNWGNPDSYELAVLSNVVSDNGKCNFTANWTATHHYSASGNYVINAKVHHANETGAEASASPINITISDPVTTGSLVVMKEIRGTTTVATSSFSITVKKDGADVATKPADTLGTAFGNLLAGVYQISEGTLSAGWENSFSSNCAGGNAAVAAGATTTCTLTNTFTATGTTTATTTATTTGTLIVIKSVQGGTSTPSDFTMNVSGATTTSFAGSASGTVLNLNLTGTTSYSVWESNSGSNYASSSSADCAGNIAQGETKRCTITNTYTGSTTATTTATSTDPTTGILRLIKHVITDNGSRAVASDFSLNVMGAGLEVPKAIIGSEEGTDVVLNPGAFSVSEATSSLFTTTYSNGCSGTIVAGATTTCTVTNNDVATGGSGSTTATSTASTTGSATTNDDRRSGSYIGGQVLGASIGPDVLGAGTSSCGIFLKTYIKRGVFNSPSEVVKLQTFLNKWINPEVKVNGIYDFETEQSVRKFQMMFSDGILKPWVKFGLASEKTSTGYVYKTTRHWINLLSCPAIAKVLPQPQLP